MLHEKCCIGPQEQLQCQCHHQSLKYLTPVWCSVCFCERTRVYTTVLQLITMYLLYDGCHEGTESLICRDNVATGDFDNESF